jgi:hypothetical protein
MPTVGIWERACNRCGELGALSLEQYAVGVDVCTDCVEWAVCVKALEDQRHDFTHGHGRNCWWARHQSIPMAAGPLVMRAKYNGRCQAGCGQPIRAGRTIAYVKGVGAYHWGCRPNKRTG